MRVSASLGFWYFLIYIVVWRQILKINSVQQGLHSILGGNIAPVLQWYTLYFVGVIFYMSYSIRELLTEYDYLDDATINANLERTYHLPQNIALGKNMTLSEFKEPLRIEPWLRYLNLASQFAGVPVVIVACIHVWKLLVLKGKALAEQHTTWQNFPWKPPTRMNWLLLVITMPTMFSVMSMRATCRIWAVMTGTAHGHEKLPWPRVETVEFAMYTSDLELAALFQFSTVYSFARICGSFLTEAVFFRNHQEDETLRLVKEYTFTIKTAGFLGVWAFVVVGAVRCIFDFCIAEAVQFESLAERVGTFQQSVFETISTVFSALTMLCVINMFIICKVSTIESHLGKANQKFLGTRLLLLCGEIQEKIIAAFTVGKPLYHQVELHATQYNIPIHRWKFSEEQAHLFHLSLLNFECLVVVIFNLYSWYHLDIEKSKIMNFKPIQSTTNKETNKEQEFELLLESDEAGF